MYGVSLALVPLPQFSTYIALTLLSLFLSWYHVWVNKQQLVRSDYNISQINQTYNDAKPLFENCIENYWCLWSIVNFGYACLLIIGVAIQNICFGNLRQDEHANIREKFWNFLFYKLIFIYGILNLQTVHELLLWATWSSMLGFMHLLTGLIKDRLEFIVQSSNIKPSVHLKMIILLSGIIIVANGLSFVSFIVGLSISFNLMFFMLAEVFNLYISTCSVISRYAIHFFIEAETSNPKGHPRSYQSVLIHYSEMIFNFVGGFVEFIHYLHMLLWSQTFVNMTTLVVGMQLQYIYCDIHSRYCIHKRYASVARSLNTFTFVKRPKVNCPICWEAMSRGARVLACGHEFHDPCLREWLQCNSNCPICRDLIFSNGDAIKLNTMPSRQNSLERLNGDGNSSDEYASETRILRDIGIQNSPSLMYGEEAAVCSEQASSSKQLECGKQGKLIDGSDRPNDTSDKNVNYDVLLFHNILLNELSNGRMASRNGRRFREIASSSLQLDSEVTEDSISSLLNLLDSAIGDKNDLLCRIKSLSERLKIDIEDVISSIKRRNNSYNSLEQSETQSDNVSRDEPVT